MRPSTFRRVLINHGFSLRLSQTRLTSIAGIGDLLNSVAWGVN